MRGTPAGSVLPANKTGRPPARVEWAFPATLPGSPYGISLPAMGIRKPL